MSYNRKYSDKKYNLKKANKIKAGKGWHTCKTCGTKIEGESLKKSFERDFNCSKCCVNNKVKSSKIERQPRQKNKLTLYKNRASFEMAGGNVGVYKNVYVFTKVLKNKRVLIINDNNKEVVVTKKIIRDYANSKNKHLIMKSNDRYVESLINEMINN